MVDAEVIRQRIEESRELLNRLGKKYGLRHPKVLKQSMELDELLNRYNKAACKKGCSRLFESNDSSLNE